ncbi:hypothetical protein ACFFQW_05290 [Umezawaea endophytica]|uniref:Uncharacterized protein n=1 Tax=Umezawaea endophytica TaxID=1654476 RepID=A0A9X2VJF3_9PSEU|nr:hypothetical protein [Umezawaea endophytica]MCS7476213.1 hypothetical protein [Umezawaea endophytica]
MISTRQGAAVFATTGLLFLAYPVFRPYEDETTFDGLRSFTTTAWITAHLAAVLGFILLPLGLQALRASRTAFLLTWFGVGLTLPYYGAEIFGLHAIGDRSVADGTTSLLSMVDTIRYNPYAATMFATGLLLIAAGTITTAAHIWRSAQPRWSAIPLAAGFTLFIPQFFTTAPFRIAHGALIAAGCAWLAVELWRHPKTT